MASSKTLDDLTVHFLRDLYYAERQILRALSKMQRAAQSPKLKEAFTKHREQTEHHVERLQQAFEAMGTRARGHTCEAINGIIEEGEEILEEFPKGPVLDAALLANAQAVEHYEMARYGSAIAWAKASGKDNVAKLLEETCAEEKQTDQLLNQLANSEINQHAFRNAA
jgi:ferritin-like metal-binding protein YciE